MIDDDKAEGQGGAGNSSDKSKNKSKQSRRGNKNRPVFKTNQVNKVNCLKLPFFY